MSYSKLKFHNASKENMTVILEPWGDEYILKAMEYIEIEYANDRELEIELEEKLIVIHGELDVEFKLKINNKFIVKKLTHNDFTEEG